MMGAILPTKLESLLSDNVILNPFFRWANGFRLGFFLHVDAAPNLRIIVSRPVTFGTFADKLP
jgi:hypothetical protein